MTLVKHNQFRLFAVTNSWSCMAVLLVSPCGSVALDVSDLPANSPCGFHGVNGPATMAFNLQMRLANGSREYVVESNALFTQSSTADMSRLSPYDYREFAAKEQLIFPSTWSDTESRIKTWWRNPPIAPIVDYWQYCAEQAAILENPDFPRYYAHVMAETVYPIAEKPYVERANGSMTPVKGGGYILPGSVLRDTLRADYYETELSGPEHWFVHTIVRDTWIIAPCNVGGDWQDEPSVDMTRLTQVPLSRQAGYESITTEPFPIKWSIGYDGP